MTEPLPSIAQALTQGYQQLTMSDSAKLDARVLLSFALGQSLTYLLTWPQRRLNAEQFDCYAQLLARRVQGEPVAYLVGEREFWSLPFKVSASTLIPRPDTEVLVEHALTHLSDNASLLDLGTGTGAIAIAIAHERPSVNVSAVDIREDALQLAKHNAELNQVNVNFRLSSWFNELAGEKFDVIVSNPPYIDAEDPHLQQGDVRFEPSSALIAEQHGLADIIEIIKNAPQYLHAQGWLLIEHGYQQGDALARLLHEAGFSQIATHCDYGGQPRVTQGQYRSHDHD
ncbi:peptide chain release factor N(5)-glutamine methyltransferase [Celerinatantimonas yamalensis]|uniref:Release factor glutamine methyltransferase n=1 Tax=Celerinatantimonas yamalensis TaxID=559956 RepID=A0ABW9G790_9GAMM